jgi:hypothetical protein
MGTTTPNVYLTACLPPAHGSSNTLTTIPEQVKVKVEVTLRLTTVSSQSVSQYVLVSSTIVGLVTRYYFLSECCCLKFTKVEVTLWLTVSQYVLVSSTLVGLVTIYYFLSECCCLAKVEVPLRLTVDQSVSQYVLVSSTLVGLMTLHYFLLECCYLKFAVSFLWGALSDERMDLQNVQCNHSMVRVAQNP